MRVGEWVLVRFSRDPAHCVRDGDHEWSVGTALSLLRRVYPNFLDLIRGKSVLDFGCGFGYQSVALALSGARYVLGIDLSDDKIGKAKALAEKLGVAERVEFGRDVPRERLGTFDAVISQNSMEHFPSPDDELRKMRSAVSRNGAILVTFGPPWFAPYGSHMQFFTNLPWVNLLFSEDTVMRVRARYRSDGATRYEEVEGGLNRMSLAKFERLVRSCHTRIVYRKYEAVKRMDWLTKVPVARELLTNHASFILSLA